MNITFTLICFACSFFLGSSLFGQVHEWTKTFQGDGSDYGTAIATDHLNNIIVTGHFSSSIDFDPGGNVAMETTNGGDDIFIEKLDPNGGYLWSKSIGGIHKDQGYDVAIDGQNNIYVVGVMMNTVDFDPGPGTFNLTSSGLRDVFVLKLDENGNFLWAKNFGSNQDDYGYSVTTDDQGNVLISGKHGGIADLDPGAGVFNSGANSGWTGFAVKLSASGDFLWANSFESGTEAFSVITDSQNSVLVTGDFENSISYDLGNGTQTMNAVGNKDIFAFKFDENGQLIWVNFWGSPNSAVPQCIQVDNQDNVYLSGYASSSTLDMDPGTGVSEEVFSLPNESFLIKMDTDGNYVWAKHLQGRNNYYGHSTCVAPNGDVFTTGYFNGTHDFDPGSGISTLSSNGDWDVYIQRFNSDGEQLWVRSLGGISLDCGMGLDLDQNGNLYVAGYYTNDQVDFNPDDGVEIHDNLGWQDIFVQKYHPDGNDDTNNPTDPPELDLTEILILPNVITSNDDHINDRFVPITMSENIIIKEIVILNRWGNVVYTSDSFSKAWDGSCDGTPCSEGTYFWQLTYEVDGTSKSINGAVSLLR